MEGERHLSAVVVDYSLIKRPHIRQNEMRTLMEMHIGGHLRSLQKENARLRLENAALRGY